jgi:hypothetical protein
LPSRRLAVGSLILPSAYPATIARTVFIFDWSLSKLRLALLNAEPLQYVVCHGLPLDQESLVSLMGRVAKGIGNV